MNATAVCSNKETWNESDGDVACLERLPTYTNLQKERVFIVSLIFTKKTNLPKLVFVVKHFLFVLLKQDIAEKINPP